MLLHSSNSSICSYFSSHLYRFHISILFSMLIVLLVSLFFTNSPKSDHAPALGSEAYPSAPPARSSSLIGASAPRHFLSRLADKLFLFLYSALPAFIGGSVSGGTCNFFSRGAVFRHNNCLRVLFCTSQTPPLYYETAHLADQTRQSCDQLFLTLASQLSQLESWQW